MATFIQLVNIPVKKHISHNLAQLSLLSEFLTRRHDPQHQHHFRTSAGEVRSDPVPPLPVPLWKCDMITCKHLQPKFPPLPSLKRDAERCRQGDSTRLGHSSTPSRPGRAPHPLPLPLPTPLAQRAQRQPGQNRFRRGAEATAAAWLDPLLGEGLP